MGYALLLAILGASLGALAFATRGCGAIVLAWCGASFFSVGVLYAIAGHRSFGKRADGTVSLARLAWIPFLAIMRVVHETHRLYSGERASDEIAPGLHVGRRPRRHELPAGVTLVVDMCTEFPAARDIASACDYVCVPTLDGAPPSPRELARAVEAVLAAKGPVLVHCAAGHGRSAMVALLASIVRGTWLDLDTAERAARAIRPGIRLNGPQRRAAAAFLAARS